MINIFTTTLNKIKSISLLLFLLVLTSCGTFNSVDYNSNDGIYDGSENVSTASSNGVYYKDYFDQKAQEYGLNTNTNDSIITDINSYSSATNTDITYNNSYGSWGDSPDSINIEFRDRNFMGAYMSNYYSPFYMNSWYMSPFGNNFYNYNYYHMFSPYSWYGGYSYWDYMFNPYGYGRYGGAYDSFYYLNNHNSNFRNNDKSTAYINGRRISGSSNNGTKIADLSGNSNTSTGGRDISNYNVGRNELDVNDSSNSDKSSDEIIKSRNINRVYYSLKNLSGNSNIRGYQNEGEINNGGGSNTTNRSYNKSSNGKSNFQLSRKRSNGNTVNSSNKRSYDVSRTSNGNQNSNNSKNKSYNVSRSSSSSSNNNSRSSYSSPTSRSSTSASSSSRSSVGSSKGRR